MKVHKCHLLVWLLDIYTTLRGVVGGAVLSTTYCTGLVGGKAGARCIKATVYGLW